MRRRDGERLAQTPGPTGAADTVNVILGVRGHVKVEHMADRRNVQTPRRHVRRNQQMHRAIAETVQRAGPHRLIQITVDGRGVETMLFQRLGNHIDIHLAVAEDDGVGAAFALGPDQGAQNGPLFGKAAILAGGGEFEQLLFDGQAGGRLTRHLDLDRSFQEGVGDTLNFRRHGRAEEQRLAARRGQLEDAFDIGDEPHVEHAVRLVHHHDLDPGQQQLAAFVVVQQAARRRDQHVDAPVDQLVLFAKRHAADQQGLGQLGVFGIGVKVFRHLCGQFACRCQHQRTRHPGAGTALTQEGDHRQHKARGLAGAGLGNAQHVAPFQCRRDRLGLNRCRCFIACIHHGLQHAGVQREIGKFGHIRPKMPGHPERMGLHGLGTQFPGVPASGLVPHQGPNGRLPDKLEKVKDARHLRRQVVFVALCGQSAAPAVRPAASGRGPTPRTCSPDRCRAATFS